MEYFFLIAFPWNISDLVASKSISAHEFTIASCSLNDLQQGFGDEKTIFKLSTNSDSSVTCLDTLVCLRQIIQLKAHRHSILLNYTLMSILGQFTCRYLYWRRKAYHLSIASNRNSQLFKTKPLKFIRTLSRKPGTRVAKCASNGLVAIGSE